MNQQLVQSVHAALESGIMYGNPQQTEPSSIVMIAVKNQSQLTKAAHYLSEVGIKTVSFIEPDWDYGLTAIATEPLTLEQRSLLRRFQCWKAQ